MKKLERRLGLVGVVAISLSAMLGSGLFVLPGLAAAKTGPSVWLAYLLAAVCVLPAALSKSELATAMPFSGGTYVYIERSFGPLAGTISGLGLWASFMLKSAFALVGFAAYLEVMSSDPVHDIRVVALALLVGIMGINILGVRAVSKIQVVVMVASLGGLAVLAGWGMTTRDPALTRPLLTHGTSGVFAAAGFVFVAYAGVTKVAAIAEEVKDPDRNLPLGILLALLVSSAIYATVAYVMVSNVPVSELSADLRPVYTFAKRVGGSVVGQAAAGLAVVTMVSMGLAGVLASSRFPFAMGRDHLLPPGQASLSGRFGTPVNAILVTGLAMALALAFLDVEKIAKLASGFKIMIFMAVNLSVIMLREANVQWYTPKFKAPLYPLTQILGIGLGVLLLVVMGATALIGAGALVALGVALFLAYGRSHATHTGQLQMIGQRKDLLPPAGMAGGDTSQHQIDLPAAEVVVPMFGWEVTPDALVEVGAALIADSEKIEVLRIEEVPLHTSLGEAAEVAEDAVDALERRIDRLADELHVDVHFDSVWSRDMRESVHEYARRTACRWMVMEYIPRERRGTFLRDPLSWLLTHLPCNLALFKDAGGHHGRRILVVIEPGPHDSLVVLTAARLARTLKAELTFYRALAEKAQAWEVEAVVDYHEQLGKLVEDVPCESRVERHARPVSALIRATADYDLLVTGAPREQGMLGMFFGTAQDRVMEHSVCSVLRLKTPRKETHRPVQKEDDSGFDLLSYIRPGLARTGLGVTSKKDMFRQVAEMFCTADASLGSTAELEAALWHREKMQNTAIGDGVAIPHATVVGITETTLGVLTLAEPLDYQAAGAGPVSLVFVTVGPPSDRSTHLQLLASLSGLLLQTGLVARLTACPDAESVRAAFAESVAELPESS